MENISNLSSNLPPTKPVNEEALKDLDQELSLEFKNAAKSVASLYKLSLQKQSMLKYKGYLDCINDLLNIIKNDDDVENWALMKKLELEGKLINEDSKNESTASDQQNLNSSILKSGFSDISQIQNQDFTMSYPSNHKFPPTMPLLSVDHSNHKSDQRHRSQRHNNTKDINNQSSDPVLSPSSEDDSIIDDSASKRKIQSMRVDKRMKH
ncbi:hypothetical protein BN7_545 [Wickerhamomyces ciferrii]|uniref:Uncharacterized protein n=1 Tax=Wickerhamomyces ciferrii (strain ATCC 14091 / BCRC 22168 / CBS 111 / JCM 3599 / NBRC 0793 / NRRL Y-1031 F-60-10) TaxID=1206466 RepID=K0KIL9_WICCF|nr:uncharacterized protein BN7_545 [Wickerhamomyces ciferrii]CCH41008.1 hypothetical protein BN7_545 [Wickerhamomyces ciferrii]